MAANYTGRRAPNVSQYIANLNTIPSAADLANQQDFNGFDDDLAMFTNTQFFDFDMNENVPEMPTEMPFAGNQGQPQNMVNQPNFQFPDFSAFPPQRLSSQGLPPTPPNGMAFPQQQQQQQQQQPSQMAPQHAFAQPSPQTGEKRKSMAPSISSPVDLDDSSRYAAEEDKRRRNTAASARFRVKKKQREQALEKTSREMSEKVSVLEARVNQLEMENKWLKGLITEKNLKGSASPTPTPTSKKIAADVVESETTQKEDGERSTEQRKDGVGTGN